MGKIRITLGAIFIASLALVCATGPIATAAPSVGGYSVRPGEIDPKDPATRAYFKPVLKPGATSTLHVIVTNLSTSPLKVLVDSVDGLTGQTSGAVYANRQDAVAKAGVWVVPSVHSVTVGPRGTQSVAFTISVPAGATPGDHLAGIAFENTVVGSSGGSFGVKEVVREVVGIQIRVPGATSTHLKIGGLALQSLPGTAFASVIVNLTNDGALLCKPLLAVTLQSPNGRSRTVTRKLDTVLPGDTIPYPLPWPDSLAAGQYVARASTSECGPAATTADVPLVLGAPLNGSQPTSQVPASSVRFPNLSLVLTVGLAFAGILFGLLLGKRRRRKDEQPATPVPATPIPVRFARLEDYQVPVDAGGLRRIERTSEPAGHSVERQAEDRNNGFPVAHQTESADVYPEQQSFWP